MSEASLTAAMTLVNQAGALIQMVQTRSIKVNSGQGALTPSEKTMFINICSYLMRQLDKFIIDEHEESATNPRDWQNIPDWYERVCRDVYDDIVTLKRALSLSDTLSRHNLPLKLETDRDITNATYQNYLESLITAERESETHQDSIESSEYGEAFD